MTRRSLIAVRTLVTLVGDDANAILIYIGMCAVLSTGTELTGVSVPYMGGPWTELEHAIPAYAEMFNIFSVRWIGTIRVHYKGSKYIKKRMVPHFTVICVV